MDDLARSLHDVADRVAAYRRDLASASVSPSAGRATIRAQMAGPVPETGAATEQVIAELEELAQPGLMASAGPRYFGFVVGGSIDAALAADMLTSGWDQAAFNEALSPAAMAFEDVSGRWLKGLLRIPPTASVGFVTGAQAANNVGLAAARWKVLRDRGWDVGVDGLFGAPRVRVVVGQERHATVDRSLRLLGMGEASIAVVPARSDGAMDASMLGDVLDSEPTAPTIVVAQSGNVNTGAFDDLERISEETRRRGHWLHAHSVCGPPPARRSLTSSTASSMRTHGDATGTSG